MKLSLVCFFVLSLLISPESACAEGWEWLNPLPSGNGINNVATAGSRFAWTVDDAGIVMRSIDGGLTWVQQDVPIQIGRATLTFVDSLYGWVAGGFANPGEDGIIIHTSDGGNEWVQQAGGISHFILDIDFVDRNHGWVVAQSRFYGPYMIVSTTNSGTQWDTLVVLSDYSLISIDFVTPTQGWTTGKRVSDSACVLHTSDGGTSWIEQLTLNDTYFSDVCFLDSLMGWAIASCGLVFHTTNGGLTWDDQQLVASAGGPSRIVFWDSQNGWIASGTGAHLILSTRDGGQSWIPFQPPASAGIGSVSCWDSNRAVAVGANGYILKTEDGGQIWTETSHHRDWNGIGSGTFADSLHGWLVGSESNNGSVTDVIWCTTDGGRTWLEQSQGVNTSLKVARFVDENTGWLLGNNGIILHTSNGGADWIQQTALSGRGIASIDFHDAFHGVAVEGNVVLLTTDGGETWSEQISAPWGSLSDVAYADAQNIWAVGSVLVNPDSLIYNGVMAHSSDAGITWSQDTLEESNELIHITFGDSHVGFVTEYFGRRLFRTTDGGLSWNTCPNPCRNVIDWVNASNASDVWAIADMVEIVHSTDSGSTWTFEPLMYAHWLRTLVAPDPHHVWAIGPNGCVFRYGDALSSVPDDDRVLIPAQFSVSIYPNPFNPITNLVLSTANGDWFTIDVFDITGRLVETLSNGFLPAGIHTLRLDGSNWASGMYFTRIGSPSSNQTLKLLLLK